MPEVVPHHDLAKEQLLDVLSNILDLRGAVEMVGPQPRFGGSVLRHRLSASDDVMEMETETKIRDGRTLGGRRYRSGPALGSP